MSTDTAPRCGVLMRYAKEPCARRAGHKTGLWGGHKTRQAMDNDYRTEFGREPDPFAFRDGQWVPR